MDIRSRYVNDDETLQTLADAVRAQIFTAIPVQVMKDSDGHTVHLKPMVKSIRRKPDGSQELVELPEMPDAPVNFPSGGGVTTTHPIKTGDIGYALVMSRSIDVWHQNGGDQPQVDARMHDLSDAIYMSGLRPTPNKLENVSKTSAQMRSNDGKHVFDLNPKSGPSMAADGGKHVVAVNPDSGISMKTAMALAIDATKGMNVKGATHFADAVTSAASFGAPTLNGSTGGVFGGALAGFVGALVGAGAMLLAMGSQPAPTGQIAGLQPHTAQVAYARP